MRRPKFGRQGAALVTLRVRDHVWNLRSKRCFKVIFKALHALRELEWIRIVDYAVLGNHIHFIVEMFQHRGDVRRALARGMQSLTIRIARGLNRVMGLRGKVFAGRYDARPLRDAFAARKARAYVVNNARHHFVRKRHDREWVDEFSSAHHFEGWKVALTERQLRASRELRQYVTSQIRRELPSLRVPSRGGVLELKLDGPEVAAPRYWALRDAFGEFEAMPANETPGPRRSEAELERLELTQG